MKTILKILIGFSIVGLLSIGLVFSDFASSIVPGWHVTLLPQEFKAVVMATFNLILPVYFLIKFYRLISIRVFIAYLTIVNFIYGLGCWLRHRFETQTDIDIREFEHLASTLLIMFVTTIVLHMAFYAYLLYLIKKARDSANTIHPQSTD